jgi:hypothetical protein
MGVTLEAQLQQQPSVQEGYERFRKSLDEALNTIADEMARFSQEDRVADAAVRFALMSYAAGLVSSHYVAQLRERAPAQEKAKKGKNRSKKEEI